MFCLKKPYTYQCIPKNSIRVDTEVSTQTFTKMSGNGENKNGKEKKICDTFIPSIWTV